MTTPPKDALSELEGVRDLPHFIGALSWYLDSKGRITKTDWRKCAEAVLDFQERGTTRPD